LAGIYSACDVGLTTSLGEGFGLATVEFQACGVPVITSNFAASAELAGPQSWLVDGQPLWDATQDAWFNTPSIPSIVEALEKAYKVRGQDTSATVKWAQQYASERVYDTFWRPILRKLL
jgi:glycosyltransferase involved in cell wall biosynthesis